MRLWTTRSERYAVEKLPFASEVGDLCNIRINIFNKET